MSAAHSLEPTSSDDIIEAVRATSLLADVTLHMWGAERNDPAIILKAKEDAGAVGNVGRAVKNLLAGADVEYKATRTAYSAVRVQHHALTLPWVSDVHATRAIGPRLLPTALWDRYITAMQTARSNALQALENFIAVYPDRIKQAQDNLRSLASADEYPDPDQVRSAFRVSFDFNPVPSGASFKGLPEGTLAKLDAQLRTRQQVMVQSANDALWDEVKTRLGRFTTVVSSDIQLRQPTVSSVTELADLLPGWNIAQDARVIEVEQDIRRMFDGLDAAKLREDEVRRADVSGQAQAVMDKLASWGL